MTSFEGTVVATDLKIALVISRFNDLITDQLKQGAVQCFLRHGGQSQDLTITYVPGAFEIPLVAKKLAASSTYDAVVCLGAVIRGATPHFDHLCSTVISNLSQIAIDAEKPVTFGVLTTDTIEHAIERAGTKVGNKGEEAMVAAIEMANLLNLPGMA